MATKKTTGAGAAPAAAGKTRKERVKQQLIYQFLTDIPIGDDTTEEQFVDVKTLKASEVIAAKKEIGVLANKDPDTFIGKKVRIIAVKDEFPIQGKLEISLGD